MVSGELFGTEPAAIRSPAELGALGSGVPIDIPGTVAEALTRAGLWDVERPRFALDDRDWWVRVKIALEGPVVIDFEGLATLVDVWVDGVPVLRSESMWTASSILLPDGGAELVMRFAALNQWLSARPTRPRPRWRTRLVDQQNLRSVRTSLLGRIPGWSPPAPVVGPWRPIRIRLADDRHVAVRSLVAHGDGRVEFEAVVAGLAFGTASIRIDGSEHPVEIRQAGGASLVKGRVRVSEPTRWWPHTHGAAALSVFELVVDGAVVHEARIGFRDVEVDTADGGFGLAVNGVPIFARGACWTPGAEADVRPTLVRLRDAGANMVRVGGTMAYETQTFYETCDELGIMVWHDFMFANLDVPLDDEVLTASIETEARAAITRLRAHPCAAVLCGGSEVDQQAAMRGVPETTWTEGVARCVLAPICAEMAPDLPFVASSPTGGTLPFQADRGVTHYYGIGAYMRPLDDARRANVRFAAECLAFAHVGETDEHWARVPRDSGAGWDFADVRDHYLRELFGVDPMRVRYADLDRYLDLCRMTTAEVVDATMAEWRRPGSSCRGALVWFWRDLWPGSGWGFLDHRGEPKPAYWAFRRRCQPVSVGLTDEGINGLHAHVVNDRPVGFRGRLRARVFRDGQTLVEDAVSEIEVARHSGQTVNVDALFPGFRDLTWAYRFGPPIGDVIVVTLTDEFDEQVSEAFHFPSGRSAHQHATVGLRVRIDGRSLVLDTERFAFGVHLDVGASRPNDNWFHLAPGRPRVVLIDGPIDATVYAINSRSSIRVVQDR